jgi:integrase
MAAAEVKLAEGRLGDPRRGRKLFRTYALDEWLPHHVMEATTRETYTYELSRHVLPWFGDMRMADILPGHVREWVTTLQEASLSPASIAKLRFILSSIFTTALNDLVVNLHPCKGVKTPTIAKRPMQIITPEQFDRLYSGLPNADMQLLVETDIETGMRWGELTELRVKDLDRGRRTITIARAVVQVNPKFHPDGQRFLVKDYPKDGEHRRVKISTQLVDKIAAHIDSEGLGTDDLLFELRDDRSSPARRPTACPPPETLGFTEPNEKGRTYRHGSLSAYNGGRCRCRHCKDGYAIYRAQRRDAGKDRSDRSAVPQSARPVDTDGHIPRDWFRNQVWTPAKSSAALPFHVRVHDLRHAHASWLVAGGADLQAVKERLGHGSIRTTERYLHTLEDHDEGTVEAFENIRYRSTNHQR